MKGKRREKKRKPVSKKTEDRKTASSTREPAVYYDISRFMEGDIYLFKEGSHFMLFDKLGAHPMKRKGKKGTYFAVWAPNARGVTVIGNFNEWKPEKHPLSDRDDGSGIWEGFIEDIGVGELYKFHIVSRQEDYAIDKSDPFAFATEIPPKTASKVFIGSYKWKDNEWMKKREKADIHTSPVSIYEVHLGSWKRKDGEFLNYRDIAHLLADHVKKCGFTHVELLPVMEHPFYGSWGYQTLSYFAPTARYGSPEDLKYFIDHLHQNNIGVILDWVPSHFPGDEHGLAFFDGTHLYEHADKRKGFHPDWKSMIFNYGRNEVAEFLISSASFWLDKYHADRIRVDAVASMLYLDYSRKEGEWIPNEFGGNENLDALFFLRRLNEHIYAEFPGVQTFAEESTAWPMVSRPTYLGGLGFGFKWDMGWMHDTLDYMSMDPVHRKYHHERLTFRMLYAFTENFVLSLSHDETVYGKGSLIGKMKGDEWQRFANLRLMMGYMFTQPGKKLLFMGGEFGQKSEWTHEGELDWKSTPNEHRIGLLNWIEALNRIYREKGALHLLDCQEEGFQWVDCSDSVQSVISFLRLGYKNSDETEKGMLLVVCNFTPMVRKGYNIGVPKEGKWRVLLNSDAIEFCGSGVGNREALTSRKEIHGRSYTLVLDLPPLGIMILEPE